MPVVQLSNEPLTYNALCKWLFLECCQA